MRTLCVRMHDVIDEQFYSVQSKVTFDYRNIELLKQLIEDTEKQLDDYMEQRKLERNQELTG